MTMEAVGAQAEGESKKGLAPDQRLPSLRDDLSLVRGPRNWRGEPTWTIQDPVRNRFVQVSEQDFYLLAAWREGVVADILRVAQSNAGIHYDIEDLESLLEFLVQQELLVADAPGLRGRLARLNEMRHQSWYQMLLHKYLFFRIPLVRPDEWLDRLYPRVRILLQPWFILVSVAAGLVGLFFIVKSWSLFLHSYSYLFTLGGMVTFTLSLVGVKILHELGHALMCKHYGLRVPTMGVAFMVMWPVLYTDATDSWRLASRRQRAAIAAAGVGTEMLLACYAMLAWVMLPDGIARAVALVVATTAWITSVLVNLNPLMRFDGYYFLSDFLNVPNLQDRAIAIAKWRLRKWLFGHEEPCPDDFSHGMLRFVTVYAWALLIYRFFLFLGIALLVYHFFFKALGVFLFAVELWWFIVRPILNEIKSWPELASSSSVRRKKAGALLLLVGLVVLLFPWQREISAPAEIYAANQFRVYSGQPAVISEVHAADGQRVNAGDLLVTLHSPDMEQARISAEREVERLERLSGQASTSDQMVGERLVIIQRLSQARATLAATESALARLAIRAPFDGVVRDVDRSMHPGRWVDADARFLTLVQPGKWQVAAWLTEEERDGTGELGPGRFYADAADGFQAVDVSLTQVSQASVSQLDSPYQASLFGGAIPVEEKAGAWRPSAAYFRAVGEVDGTVDTAAFAARQRGTLVIEGERSTLLGRALVWLLGVLVRETGF